MSRINSPVLKQIRYSNGGKPPTIQVESSTKLRGAISLLHEGASSNHVPLSVRAKVIIKFFRKLQEDKYLLSKIFKYVTTLITSCYPATYNHKMALRNLAVRSTILQQIRCNRSRKAKDSSKSRSSTHLLLGSEAPCALDQFAAGRHLRQLHPNRGNSTPQIRLYTSQLEESDKIEETNQYWSLIGAVLVRSMYQYWSELRPVLVSSVTSTG